MHYSRLFSRKIGKTVKGDQQQPQNVVPQGLEVRAFYRMIRRLSSTLSCNKTLVINIFFFKVLICLG